MDLACPFVYSDGRKCSGRIVKVEAYKADITWERAPDGTWEFWWNPRSHHHLFCSEKGNHAGHKKQDDDRMKFRYDQLPPAIQLLLESTSPQEQLDADADA